MSVQAKSTLNRASSRMASTQIATTLRDALARLVPSSSGSLLPFIPKPLKAFLLLLVILNSPSFPFQWHIRVWFHAIKAYYLVWRKGRTKYLDDWEARNVARGQVKGVVTAMKRIAWVDDCDYNMHLSNSCYSKNSDPARMDYCIQSLSPGFTPGIAMALAGSHYIFIKEIPMGSEYTMETRVIGWGDKWYYPVTEFIIYPKKGKGKGKARASGSQTSKALSHGTDKVGEALQQAEAKLSSAASSSTSGLPAPTPGNVDVTASSSVGDSGIATPVTKPSGSSEANGVVPIQDLEEAKRAALRQRPPRADGGVVACIAVWEYCFKIGRLTVPPRVALYVSLQSPLAADRAAARKIILSKDKGRAWVSGGWKKEPNADEIGRDIGLTETEVTQAKAAREKGEEHETWITKGRKAMEKMTLGLASVENPK